MLLAFNTLALADSSDKKEQTKPARTSIDIETLSQFSTTPNPQQPKITIEDTENDKTKATEKDSTETTEKEQFTTITLEKTAIGQAVISGKKIDYIAALRDLKEGFHIDLIDIITKTTSDGKNLMELMITAPFEKEYFAREMFHSLIAITHLAPSQPSIPRNNPKLANLQLSHISTVPINVKYLLKKAKEVDNTTAYQLLNNFQKLLALLEGHSQQQIETMQALLRSSKYDTRWTSAGVSFTAAGILSILGYTLLFNSNEAHTFLSLLLSKAPVDVTSYNLVKIAGAGALAVSAGMTIKGFKICQKAFRKANQLKQIEQNMANRISIGF